MEQDQDQLHSYIENLYAEDPDLERVGESLKALGLKDISVAPGYGRLLTMMVRMTGARRVLEIGAFGGYSGICLARGVGPEGRVVSLEVRAEFAELARTNLQHAGLAERVEHRVGEALEQLKRMEQEGERFDLFFIDADKGNYPAYLEMALVLGRPGALIVGDNTFMRGKTLDPAYQGGGPRSMRLFNERIASHPMLESTILPAYDGLAIARIKD